MSKTKKKVIIYVVAYLILLIFSYFLFTMKSPYERKYYWCNHYFTENSTWFSSDPKIQLTNNSEVTSEYESSLHGTVNLNGTEISVNVRIDFDNIYISHFNPGEFVDELVIEGKISYDNDGYIKIKVKDCPLDEDLKTIKLFQKDK